MARRYRDVAAKMQQNVQKHLQEMKELSSSDEEDPYESSVLEGVFRSYWSGGGDAHSANRTQNLLQEAISGRSVTCLICISSIKRADPIWACAHCYSYFHISCIQKWANDSISLRTMENSNSGPIVVCKPKKVEWCCPKCRHSYSKDEIPRRYQCFCGKSTDPPVHPWLIPHSCGEICEKRLSIAGNCLHRCLLLCHPGPCPPCPQTVRGVCYCGKEQKHLRCSTSKWSCQKPCKKLLLCKSHECGAICHEGHCMPCSFTSVQPCLCGAEKTKRLCSLPKWQCEKRCNKPFSCGFHKCDKVCHSSDCGSCPYSGIQSCPCGANQRFVQCPDVLETCKGTCNREHENCEHNCPEKCHKGPCPPCQVLVQKECFCGAHTRSLPCSKEYKCDTKCRGIRPCNKHPCARKCCNGNCPPCEKTCDKPLQCGKHKCSMVCHQGPCYPCPLESKVTCRCKSTYVTVPCGREKHTKPPRCNIPCKIKYKCGHNQENLHSCHFGDCPPCKAMCSKCLPNCQHSCKATCHEFVAVVFKQVEKPATPWDIQPPKTKIMTLECPPCEIPVTVICFGEHETEDQPCHLAKRRGCGRDCGRPLACGNHTCELPCHLFNLDPNYPNITSRCAPCNRECMFPRPKNCTHKCAKKSCHQEACPPCDFLEKIPCHCGITEKYLRCRELTSVTAEMLSCKQQCPKHLECGHRCRKECHLGECDKDQVCQKKAKVYCPCGNLKKEAQCVLVQRGEAAIPCNESCEAKKVAEKIEKEKEEQKLKLLEEEKNRKELEKYEWMMQGKKKKYKEKKKEVHDKKSFFEKNWIPILGIATVLVAAGVYVLLTLNSSVLPNNKTLINYLPHSRST